MVNIKRGVPIPPKKNTRVTYPIRELKIGESFAVKLPNNERGAEALRASAMAVLTYYKKRYDIHCVSRTLVENRKRVVRIWRVKKPRR